MNAHDMMKFPVLIQRPLLPAMWRGFLGRCPNCGQGKMLDRKSVV